MTIASSAQSKGQLASGLAQGVETISQNQSITFTLYVRLVLPLDGMIFWVNATLLTDSAVFNSSEFDSIQLNNLGKTLPSRVISAKGSIHYATQKQQLEDITASFNSILFTSIQEINDLNSISSNHIYVAEFNGLKFAFNQRNSFYKQADLYHYRGDALYSIMDTQLIESMTDFNLDNLIVSNSLPVWLTLNKYFDVYPSYLIPSNIAPPYASIDIDPNNTEAIQSTPLVDINSSPNQLVMDKVKITFYGLNNNIALNFMNYVFSYSIDSGNIGLMNMPVIRDEKSTQSELGIIAMKKTAIFEINYYQSTINDVARQLITSVFVTYQPNPL